MTDVYSLRNSSGSLAIFAAIRRASVGLFFEIWREQFTAHKRLFIEGRLLVIAMLHKADFFQEQIDQCRRLVAQASNKNDREFWLQMTQRWEGLLVGRCSDATAAPERGTKIIFHRARRFANRYRAA